MHGRYEFIDGRYEFIDGGIAVVRSRIGSGVMKDDDVDPSEEEREHHQRYEYEGSSDREKKYHGRKTFVLTALCLSWGKLTLLAMLLSTTLYFFRGTLLGGTVAGQHQRSTTSVGIKTDNQTENTFATELKSETSHAGASRLADPKPSIVKDLSSAKDFTHCTQNPPQSKGNVFVEERIEPLWLPAYPTAIPDTIYSTFLVALTGVPKGAKSYDQANPQINRCHHVHTTDNVDAITCEIAHPIVPSRHPSPSDQSDKFGSRVILALRNPLTAFPAHHQAEAESYHGQQGQVDKKSWIDFRDKHVGDDTNSPLFDEWKNFIMEWRDMEPYHVEEYVPYEYWVDEKKGPALAKRLSRIFHDEGFPILFEDDGIECLWHKHFFESLVAEEKKQKEEGWYEPEYTNEQMELMASELEKFAQEIKEMLVGKDGKSGRRPGDGHLYEILTGYVRSVRRRIDRI